MVTMFLILKVVGQWKKSPDDILNSTYLLTVEFRGGQALHFLTSNNRCALRCMGPVEHMLLNLGSHINA